MQSQFDGIYPSLTLNSPYPTHLHKQGKKSPKLESCGPFKTTAMPNRLCQT